MLHVDLLFYGLLLLFDLLFKCSAKTTFDAETEKAPEIRPYSNAK